MRASASSAVAAAAAAVGEAGAFAALGLHTAADAAVDAGATLCLRTTAHVMLLLLPTTLTLLLLPTRVTMPMLQPRVTSIPSFLQRLHNKQILHLRHTPTEALLSVGALL